MEKKQKKLHQAGDRALSNMRRRAYDSFLVTSGAKEHDLLSKDELNFLQAAEIGDLPTVKQMLESDELAPKLLRCTDYKDRTALEVLVLLFFVLFCVVVHPKTGHLRTRNTH